MDARADLPTERPAEHPADTPVVRRLGDLVVGIDHVGVAVADLDSGLRWWTEVLGLTETHREENPQQQVVEVMLAAGHGERTTQVQVLAPLSDDSAVARFLSRRGPGLQHVAFAVTDLTAASGRLTAAGVRLLYPQPRSGTAGSRINFVHPRDANGVLVELVEAVSLPGIRGTD